MTRIIAGTASSLRLSVPQKGTRPTSDRVREAIFSTLESWDFISDTKVLDLYAGSGALGLEALSRGASRAVLVEKHPAAARIAQSNSETVLRAFKNSPVTPTCQVITANVQTWLAAQPSRATFDVVFLDPPYDLDEQTLAANLTTLVPLLTPHAAVLVERDRRSPEPLWPAEMRLIKQKNYGETTCWWAELDTETDTETDTVTETETDTAAN